MRFVRAILVLVALAALLLPVSEHSSFAQDSKSPSILEFFGIEPAKPKANQKKITQKAISKKKAKPIKPTLGRKKASKSKPTELSQPAVPLTKTLASGLAALPNKLSNAKTILVVGDFMADGVSEGIEQAFEDDAGVVVVSRTTGSSGFVRDDFYNWTNEIGGVVGETKPSAIVVMIGTNDRQPLRLNGEKAVVRSPQWTLEYMRRVGAFADALKATGVPFVWIGMPPFKQPSMSADMLALNDIYLKNTERTAGTFVDIWDGFLDEAGTFSINGSDYIGQPARLRASDGINLTFPGKRKAAFFAEKSLRLALGNVQAVAVSAFNPFNLPGPKPLASTQPIVITRVAPISLFDPAFDGQNELLGAEPNLKLQSTDSIAKSLYVDGLAPKPQPGRVDAPSVSLAP